MDLPLVEIFQCDQTTVFARAAHNLLSDIATVEAVVGCIDGLFAAFVIGQRALFGFNQFLQSSQQVALAEANRDMEVAEKKLDAAKDQAEAILAKASAEAAIVGFENEADAAGWKKAVEALGNDGEAFARYTLYKKLAPGYRSIMTNTADSPLMDVFRSFTEPSQPKAASPEAPKE